MPPNKLNSRKRVKTTRNDVKNAKTSEKSVINQDEECGTCPPTPICPPLAPATVSFPPSPSYSPSSPSYIPSSPSYTPTSPSYSSETLPLLQRNAPRFSLGSTCLDLLTSSSNCDNLSLDGYIVPRNILSLSNTASRQVVPACLCNEEENKRTYVGLFVLNSRHEAAWFLDIVDFTRYPITRTQQGLVSRKRAFEEEGERPSTTLPTLSVVNISRCRNINRNIPGVTLCSIAGLTLSDATCAQISNVLKKWERQKTKCINNEKPIYKWPEHEWQRALGALFFQDVHGGEYVFIASKACALRVWPENGNGGQCVEYKATFQAPKPYSFAVFAIGDQEQETTITAADVYAHVRNRWRDWNIMTFPKRVTNIQDSTNFVMLNNPSCAPLAQKLMVPLLSSLQDENKLHIASVAVDITYSHILQLRFQAQLEAVHAIEGHEEEPMRFFYYHGGCNKNLLENFKQICQCGYISPDGILVYRNLNSLIAQWRSSSERSKGLPILVNLGICGPYDQLSNRGPFPRGIGHIPSNVFQENANPDTVFLHASSLLPFALMTLFYCD